MGRYNTGGGCGCGGSSGACDAGACALPLPSRPRDFGYLEQIGMALVKPAGDLSEAQIQLERDRMRAQAQADERARTDRLARERTTTDLQIASGVGQALQTGLGAIGNELDRQSRERLAQTQASRDIALAGIDRDSAVERARIDASRPVVTPLANSASSTGSSSGTSSNTVLLVGGAAALLFFLSKR